MRFEAGPIVFGFDIDGTIRPGDECTDDQKASGRGGLIKLSNSLRAEKARRARLGLLPLYTGPMTGRVMSDVVKLANDEPLFRSMLVLESDFAITSVGAQVAWRNNETRTLVQDAAWPPTAAWNRQAISAFLSNHPRLDPQPDEAQGPAKLSYMIAGVPHDAIAEHAAELRQTLFDQGWPAQVIISADREFMCCDVLPEGIHKGSALGYVRDQIAARHEGQRPLTVFAEDGMNGRGGVAVADLTILPANADPAFRRWAQSEAVGQLVEAKQEFSHGLLEGLAHAGILTTPG